MNILIADDHAIVRKGLIELLLEEYPNAEISEAENSGDVIQLMPTKVWDVILLDISMPGRNGLDVLKQLRESGIKAPILMLSMYPEDQYAVRVLKAGASGFVNKNSATTELLVAVNKVLQGRKYITDTVAEQLAEGHTDASDKPKHHSLSDREMQVFQMLVSGKTVSDVAAEMALSVNTISTYRSRILEKLELSNNAEMTIYAVQHGLL